MWVGIRKSRYAGTVRVNQGVKSPNGKHNSFTCTLGAMVRG